MCCVGETRSLTPLPAPDAVDITDPELAAALQLPLDDWNSPLPTVGAAADMAED